MNNSITNDEMKSGRWLKRYNGKKLFNQIHSTFAAGFRVQVSTYTKATLYNPKHADMFELGKSGSVYVRSGKKMLCIDHCGFSFERAKAVAA